MIVFLRVCELMRSANLENCQIIDWMLYVLIMTFCCWLQRVDFIDYCGRKRRLEEWMDNSTMCCHDMWVIVIFLCNVNGSLAFSANPDGPDGLSILIGCCDETCK